MFIAKSPKRRAHVIGFRADEAERALVLALAYQTGSTVSDILRELLIPAIRDRLAQGDRRPS